LMIRISGNCSKTAPTSNSQNSRSPKSDPLPKLIATISAHDAPAPRLGAISPPTRHHGRAFDKWPRSSLRSRVSPAHRIGL
jgi:hypothetical protein